MKRRILLLGVVLYAAVAVSQQAESSGVSDFSSAIRHHAVAYVAKAEGDAGVAAGPTDAVGAAAQQPASPAPQNKKASKTKTGGELERPTIDSSMVGYIDNAIVGSEVRVRFDAAFNDQFPDRAEFVYAKCGCYKMQPQTRQIYDANAPGPPGPNVPDNVNFQTLAFMAEYAPKGNARFSAFVEIPFRWLQPQGPGSTPAFPNGAGISDVTAGLKFALIASSSRYLTAQLTSFFPSGSAFHGLGTAHYSLAPEILYYQRLPNKFEIEGELGGWLPIGGSAGAPTNGPQGFAGPIFFYGIGPSYRLVDNDQFRLAPVIELVGWTVTGGQETSTPPVNASGTNIVNMKFGARMTFAGRNSVYVGYGAALTSADWYGKIVRVEYRHAF